MNYVTLYDKGDFADVIKLSIFFLLFWGNYTGLSRYAGFPGGSVVKNLPVSAGDVASIPWSGRSSRERNGNPL